jgi:protein subunit release factor A
MKELHLTKKDFRVDWFSGTGAGGQYRNKHQNCCRITHIQSGITSQSTEYRERIANLRSAFNRLAKMLVAKFCTEDDRPNISTQVIRNYNESRNEVHDKASGLKIPYNVVMKKGLDEMIDARKTAICTGV